MKTAAGLAILVCVGVWAPRAGAQTIRPSQIRMDQHVGGSLPLDLAFRDADGRQVTLADCFDGKPTLLMLGYYRCPMLCGLMLEGLPRALKGVPLKVGQDYRFVMVSIAPKETPALAQSRRAGFVKALAGDPEEVSSGVHLLTGDEESIHKLAEAVGYEFAFDEPTGQYAHPTGLIVITPEGKISRYLLGIKFASRDLRLALVEAGQGKIGGTADGLMLRCYQYDPASGTYGLAVMTALRIGGGLTVLSLGSLIGLLTFRQRRIDRQRLAGAGGVS